MLAALVASLHAELAGSQAALARVIEELARARERIAEFEARLSQSGAELVQASVQRMAGRCGKERPQAGQAGRASGPRHWCRRRFRDVGKVASRTGPVPRRATRIKPL